MLTDIQIKQGVAKAALKSSIRKLNKVSKKELRLYIDLIDVWYPIYRRADDKTKANFISEIFNCDVDENDLANLCSFKEITKKKVITLQGENVKIVSRLRWRGRDNLNRNYIHFPS
jgi:hypothetical protein